MKNLYNNFNRRADFKNRSGSGFHQIRFYYLTQDGKITVRSGLRVSDFFTFCLIKRTL